MDNVSSILEGLEKFEASDSSYSSLENSNCSFEPKKHFKDQLMANEGFDHFEFQVARIHTQFASTPKKEGGF